MSTPEKKYVHGRDQQRNFANRRPDLSFMIYDEQLLGLEDYLEKLRDYIEWYRETNGPLQAISDAEINSDQDDH